MKKKCFYYTALHIFAGCCFVFATTLVNAQSFSDLQKAAKGQTVYFNAWGGDTKINSYISWAGKTLSDRHDITLIHVKLTDTASAVSRILAEKVAGRSSNGSIDLLWINGENFSTMKKAELLQNNGWAFELPSFVYVNPKKMPDTIFDFGIPTNGLESPWGRAQFVFGYNSKNVLVEPNSATILSPAVLKILPL